MASHEDVATFVGNDAHGANCSLCALSREGKIVKQDKVATRAADLRGFLKDLDTPVWVMVESGTMAGFVRDSIEKVVDRFVVCETRENRWISRSEDKSDAADARRLAKLLRMSEYKEVYLPRREGIERRELVQAYQRTVSDVVRMKLRIRSKFRRYGIIVDAGERLFDPEVRQHWLAKIKSTTRRFIVEGLYDGLDSAEERNGRCFTRMREMMSARREYKLWLGMPGVGEIVAAVFAGVIDDPARFVDKHKLWSYAGLAVSRHSSGESSEREKGSKQGNRLLKYAAMMAAQNAVRGKNRFSRHYEELVKARVEPAMAQKTVARGILAAALAMAKSGKRYLDQP